ncbi:peptide deformylase [Desulforudis sp. 1088]|uniref:peptide deformylase n=1 Tax=unclassified Candidatus Desulforudis TaxID=2635950 RepID=UPI0034747CA8
MAVHKIVEHPDPILKEKAVAVKEITPQILRLIRNMFDTMYAAKGIGLAAPQIGVSKRVIVVDVENSPMALINPEITFFAGRESGTEGCLSIPGYWGEVERARTVEVKALNPDGEQVVVKAEGYMARALQHEIDHLDGILFIDRATKIGLEKK